jgi:hypothetical protein
MDQDQTFNAADQWRQGVELHVAWHAFSDPGTRAAFAAAKTQNAIAARQMMMVVDLWAKLSSGVLVAFGDRVAPTLSGVPVAVPSHLFFDRPPAGIELGDVIQIAGSRYERVRICEPDVMSQGLAPAANPEPYAKSAGGRPDTYNLSKEVLEELYASPSNLRLSPENLHGLFTVEFERRFPRDSYKVSAPSLSTFRKQIRRYRQERGETCNN